jgi:hypothetical protein
MRTQRWPRLAVLSVALVLLATPRPALAYVDPGSGAMLWQLAAAGILGSLFYVRRVTAWLRKRAGSYSAQAMGFVFATLYALGASPLVLFVFNIRAVPRFSDLFLIGIVLACYRFTWQSSVYLLVLSVVATAYALPAYGTFRIAAASDVYRLISFTVVSVFVIILITRLKGKAAATTGNGDLPRRAESRKEDRKESVGHAL